MSQSERWAWWTLGVLMMTIGAYGACVLFLDHSPATSSVFALLALIAIPAFRRRDFHRISLDEREREISNKALRAGFGAFWLALIALILAVGFAKGWDTSLTVPVWILAEGLMWGMVLVSGVGALTSILLHHRALQHRGSHA